MIDVDLSFINNELKLNMDRLRIIKQNNSLSVEERNKRIEVGNQASFLYNHMYNYQYTDGLVIKEKHGVIIKQAEPYSFYRGENQLFSSCKSSFFRKYSGDITIDKLISDMKIELFARVISELDLIKKWDYCNVFPEFIAQHYGLDTEYLDITGNFLVAMFFAVSRYDKELGKYVPITDDYIEEHPEHKYGYFYKRKNPDRLPYYFDKEIKVGDIIPIGFQPFMRCSSQFGYMIKCDDNYDLSEDTDYEKYCFNQSSALSKYIYSKCKEGKAIMPYEGLTKLLPVVEIIKNTSTFDNICLDNALNVNSVKEQKEDILRKLKSKNISIVDKIDIDSIVSKEQIELIDTDYKDFDFKEYYGIECWTIPVKKPTARVQTSKY